MYHQRNFDKGCIYLRDRKIYMNNKKATKLSSKIKLSKIKNNCVVSSNKCG